MKGADFLADTKGVVILVGLGVAGYLIYKLTTAAPKAAAAVGNALNPASQTNIVNTGVSAAGAAVTGNQNWSLGGQLADWFDPTTRAANEMLNSNPTSTLTSANAATTGSNDAALALYQRPIDYGTPGTSPDGW